MDALNEPEINEYGLNKQIDENKRNTEHAFTKIKKEISKIPWKTKDDLHAT